jgi:hypothetical protein
MEKERVITIEPIKVKHATVFIEGDGDLILNKMNARTVRELTSAREGKKTVKQVPNIWEDIITAVHWRDGYPTEDTYTDCDEDMLRDMLVNNAPCITGFGLKKSFGSAITQNEITKYSTKLNSSLNVVNRLEPIKFAEHHVDKSLMSPKRGAPVLVYINRFSGWSSQVNIAYTENVYSLDQLVNVINIAGFGQGIGSGRTSGYGRYHVSDVR